MQQNNQTALLMAAGGGHASVVKLLLDAKADVNHFDKVRQIYLFDLVFVYCQNRYR
jgi:ankyrin repeat protein